MKKQKPKLIQKKLIENKIVEKKLVENKIIDKKLNEKKIIEDKKLRGEWAESVFMATANQHGLPVSKPWGEMCSYDFVIGKTGRFVSVQVKSTLSKEKNGYECSVRGGHQAYPAGSFDFLAAYVVPEDVWYIIPAKLIHGKECVTLFPNSPTAKYEPYREAWELLREAVARGAAEIKEEASEVETKDETSEVEEPVRGIPRNALERMEASLRFVKKQWEP
jgi:hypothetical protein